MLAALFPQRHRGLSEKTQTAFLMAISLKLMYFILLKVNNFFIIVGDYH